MNEENNFEKSLMEKYPSLFNADENGKLVSPDCGIYCPKGWERLVDSLCHAIDYRVNHGKVFTKRKVWTLPLRVWIWNKLFFPFEKLIDPTRKVFKENAFLTVAKVSEIEASHPFRTYLKQKVMFKIRSFLCRSKQFSASEVPSVKIAQIKEKFGTLRFYYDGGDEYIRGMVSLAESMSAITCEATGESGSLVRRGYWYKTLSESKANEMGYTKVE